MGAHGFSLLGLLPSPPTGFYSRALFEANPEVSRSRDGIRWMNPSLLLRLTGRGQGKPSVFNNTYQNNRSKRFLLCLAARLDGLPRGDGVISVNLVLHQRCLMFDLWQRPTQSPTQLQVCAKDVPLPLPKACGLEGATREITRLLGVCAWGWQCLGVRSLGEFTSLCKISS